MTQALLTARPDIKIIERWVKQKSQVLDLGCGKGELLNYLKQQKDVHGYGLEISAENITDCIRNGVNVIEQNLDNGLSNFKSSSVDTVIMTQALQAVRRPDLMLDEMLRIGQEAIITFPNFGYWRTRFYLATKGRMPMSKTLPYHWYDTPNIHFFTFKDFEDLCREKGFKVLNRAVMDDEYHKHWSIQMWPSMLGEFAVYHITRS